MISISKIFLNGLNSKKKMCSEKKIFMWYVFRKEYVNVGFLWIKRSF